MEDERMLIKKVKADWICIILTFGCLAFVSAFAAADKIYKIHIHDVSRVVHKNWLGVPHAVDCTVRWEIYEERLGEWTLTDVSQLDHYQAYCMTPSVSKESENSGDMKANFYTFPKRSAGQRYGFVVKGFKENQEIAVSDTAWVVTGKLRADGPPPAAIQWHHWFPLNGRIPLAILGRQVFFDESTKAGKIAFHVIWNFFICGMICLGFCIHYLSLQHVFPLEKGFLFGRGYDEIIQKKQSKQFRNILEEWRDLTMRTHKNIRIELAKGDKIKIDVIEGANAIFWRDYGTETIHDLIKRLSESGLNRYPTVRVMQAGLENHELGGFHWLEVSKEVDRAIENRASSELESLRRKSFVDWLWHLGTLSPLLGLFGTVTGISSAFAQLTFLRSNVTQSELVKKLSGGIYEALWTTIEGLAVGVLLMILYYYYNNKLNWIYSKWEELYVYVTEKI